jgi:DnaJ homolog subfamily C member 28
VADARIDRLLQRRKRLVEEQANTTPEVTRAFNDGRRLKLRGYRERLTELIRTIRDCNLTVPTALQLRPVQVDPQMRREEDLAPPLEPETFGRRGSNGSWWTRLRRGNRR